MCNRFLNLLSVFIAIPAFASDVSGLPDAWLGTHYGTCYTSVEDGMMDVYRPDYGSDDNISQRHVAYGANEMIVSVDRTSGTNAPRTVFEKRKDGKWCVILASPPVASLTPIEKKGIFSRPLEWVTLTQTASGYPETKIVYTWSVQRSIYFPRHCYHVSKNSAKEFDCTNAYKQ